MQSEKLGLSSERVTLRAVVIALGFILIGLLLIWITVGAPWQGNRRIVQILIEQLGALFVVTAAITLVWELAAKRAFLDEILIKTQVGRDIALAGLLKITNQYLDDVDWRRHIDDSSQIDICFAYGRTWRGIYENQLKARMQANSLKIRVILPDPENERVVSELACRFDLPEEEVKNRINECVDFVKMLKRHELVGSGAVRLWFLHKCPVFSCYRFDRVGIIAFYKHQKGRGNVPTFVFEQGGVLYDFMCQELNAMVSENEGLACEWTWKEG